MTWKTTYIAFIFKGTSWKQTEVVFFHIRRLQCYNSRMFSTHCVQVLSNVNILWIVLDSALAMICAQTSDTWELCDCALFNYIEYFCLKNPCVDKFFRFCTWHFWLSNCLKSWSDCKICIFVWDFQNMVWNLGVDKNLWIFHVFELWAPAGALWGAISSTFNSQVRLLPSAEKDQKKKRLEKERHTK